MLSQLEALKAENAEPIEAIDAKLPTEPIDRNERVLPMLRTLSWDAIESLAAMPTA